MKKINVSSLIIWLVSAFVVVIAGVLSAEWYGDVKMILIIFLILFANSLSDIAREIMRRKKDE